MISVGGLVNMGSMIYGAYMQHQGLKSMQQSLSMDDVKTEIDGGTPSDVSDAVEGQDKLSKSGENYLKTAGNKPPEKPKGLGFNSL